MDAVPARAAERVSCTTAWATPSRMRASACLGTPSASTARGSVPANCGESVRSMLGAATRSPSRPTSAPRPSVWASPSKARPPRNSSSEPTASFSSTTGYSPGGSSTGSSRVTLAAARVASASGSSAAIEVPVPAAQPDRPLSWRAMTFMKASVTLSSARTPVRRGDGGVDRARRPDPERLQPGGGAALEGHAQRLAGRAGVELRGERVEAVVGGRGRRRRQARVVARLAGGARRGARGRAGRARRRRAAPRRSSRWSPPSRCGPRRRAASRR